mmetsp:Transcript_7582/g.11580  ORF Transcript_7582/g.11580 Transcript_7582/m.11580 type:complete len:225 (-) Transcript_7582:247-921(-)|eukprot:CAMPEP_0178909798 /NCGR_PEP_ID=MMETSP0786-20121207/8737_1 /TAXON_ID=186022 /ORGANISM="Thalassionema frauenfeldii, Strain CCMP 1798" /LENGTH=224 /DNA_ID=CAMNT_0020581969 /DNA_START=11 /DNA_END=685 /DNA_ORIENTATION=-
MSSTDNQTVITLAGSVDIVTEFFFTAINSILYQRGIYEPASFRRVDKYGLTVLVSTDDGLLGYLKNVMNQMQTWLLEGTVQKLVVVVAGLDSGETLERWQFQVQVDNADTTVAAAGDENNVPNQQPSATSTKKNKKTIKEIHDEIQAIIRQITASVTFLPLLNEPCSFDLLVYTDNDAVVPQKWYDSDPRYIMNSSEVKLRSFTTSIHKVDTMVTYKEKDDWEL